jgi:hypothetical protein
MNLKKADSIQKQNSFDSYITKRKESVHKQQQQLIVEQSLPPLPDSSPPPPALIYTADDFRDDKTPDRASDESNKTSSSLTKVKSHLMNTF